MRMIGMFIAMVASISGTVMAQYDGCGMMGFGCGGMFMWILFLLLVVVLVYFIIQGTRPKNLGPSGDTALDILKKRYARGEISKEDFDRMKKDLEQ